MFEVRNISELKYLTFVLTACIARYRVLYF